MKTFIMTTVGAVLLGSGGLYAAHGDQVEASSQTVAVSHVSEKNVADLPEYPTLAEQVDVSKYDLRIVEDNSYKRVIILKDSQGRDRIKSMFMKGENRLKVVDYQGGLIFNGVISNEEISDSSTLVSNETTQLPEYQALSKTVDLSSYNVQIIEDNDDKRVALYTDKNGRVQYKTVYVKETGYVKIIKL